MERRTYFKNNKKMGSASTYCILDRGVKSILWSEYKSVNLSPAKTETKGTIARTYGGYQYREKTTHKPPVDYDYVKAYMFYVNRKGIIYYWRIKGQKTEQVLLFLLGLSLVALLVGAIANHNTKMQNFNWQTRQFRTWHAHRTC